MNLSHDQDFRRVTESLPGEKPFVHTAIPPIRRLQPPTVEQSPLSGNSTAAKPYIYPDKSKRHHDVPI